MTISSTTVRNSYSGDGSTTTFSYTFKIFQDSDIQVIIRSANGTETTKTITTHYTVTGAGNSGGGSVIFTSGNIPTSTQTVVLRRNIPQTQAIDYIANDPFPAESHEEGLDRATMAIQQLQEEVTRSLKLSKTNTMTSTEFTVGASARANKILAFDTNGELSVTQELGTNRGSWSAGVTYNARDIVKDGSNNNVYLCNTTHTSTGTTPISSNADVAKWDLIVDAQSATNSANAAANSAANSSNFANNSSNSANTSANHASNSSNFANNASNSANDASTYLAGVAANASNASNFANNSSNSANASANSASNSSNFANNASNSANDSANHASNSSNHAANSASYVSAALAHASNSSNFANNSSNSANASANHAANSSNFANNSSNHASNSANHSANSSNFANNSSNHASNSSNFSNNASNFANTASNAANAANSARDAALAAADNFDDTYLGAKANDPTLDNDGDALNAGDLYYNTTSGNLKYYTGSAWVAITSGGITDLVQDTTPQLGGNLDINTYSIVSTSNGNINITPNGTGKVVLDGISYPTADGTAGQVLVTNGSGTLSFAAAETKPTITSISPSTITNDATSFTITGTNFVSVPIVEAVNSSTGAIIRANSVSFTSSTSIGANFTITTDGTYFVRVENNDGNAVRSTNAILTVSDAPTWTTSAGTLGTFSGGSAISVTVAATSDSSVSYSVVSGSLPGGLSLNSGSGVISGTESGATADTTYSFTIRATDAETQTADRAFSITITVGINNGVQFN